MARRPGSVKGRLNMRTALKALLVGTSSLSLCCATVTGSDNSKATSTDSKQAAPAAPAVVISASGAQTRVKFERECLQAAPAGSQEFVGGLLAALGTTLIPKIASAAVDAGSSYLQHRKDELTKSYSGRAAVQLYAQPAKIAEAMPTFKYPCIAFARGKFRDKEQ